MATTFDAGVIDCDVHPTIANAHPQLMSYLSAVQKDRLEWLRADRDGGYPAAGWPIGRAQHFRGAEAIRPDTISPNGGPPASDIGFVKEHLLDRHGIDAAVLIPLQAGAVERWEYPDESAWWISAWNDLFRDTWLADDPRFNLTMTVSPHEPQLAAKEIERFGSTPGVVGVFLPQRNIPFGKREWYPIYEAAQDAGLPIVTHPLSTEDYTGTAQFAGGNPLHRAERYVLLAQWPMTHLTSMIFEGVFERFPRLKIVAVEYGWAWVPWLLWRMDSTWRAARRYHPWMKKSPTEYVMEHVRFTSEPALEIEKPHQLNEILDMIQASKTLLFATDYPHWDSEEPQLVFQHLPDELRRRIFRENALELFGSRLRTASSAMAG